MHIGEKDFLQDRINMLMNKKAVLIEKYNELRKENEELREKLKFIESGQIGRKGENMSDIPTRSQLEELKLMACAKAGKNLLRARLSDTDTICDYCECAIYDCKDDSICAIQKCIDFIKKVEI